MENQMVKNCANPQCAKPLHYLREGRIFVFDAVESEGGESMHRMEHFWLCGTCSETMVLERTRQGVRTAKKPGLHGRRTQEIIQPLAS
jgi:hypothetical protein